MVKLGNWLFHYRNYLFPVFYLALFIPTEPVFTDQVTAEVAGLFFILSGMSVRCITIGLVYIVRGGKNRNIYAEDLVTGGIYSVCRNPMYLGNITLLLGFGFFANSLLFTLLFFPLFLTFYSAIIKAEENFLSDKFGESFDNYRKNVRAILPDLRLLGKAFEGQTFKWKKVFSKEHNGFFIFFSGIFLILFYKARISLQLLIASIIVLGLLNALVKLMKVRHLLED